MFDKSIYTYIFCSNNYTDRKKVAPEAGVSLTLLVIAVILSISEEQLPEDLRF